MLAAIRPRGKDRVWALPKGRIDDGESAAETAMREVREETDRGEHRTPPNRPHEHTAGRELTLHGAVLPVGTCAA